MKSDSKYFNREQIMEWGWILGDRIPFLYIDWTLLILNVACKNSKLSQIPPAFYHARCLEGHHKSTFKEVANISTWPYCQDWEVCLVFIMIFPRGCGVYCVHWLIYDTSHLTLTDYGGGWKCQNMEFHASISRSSSTYPPLVLGIIGGSTS